jgi:competence protein ComEC
LAILRKKIKIYLLVLTFFTIGLFGYCLEASTYNVKTFSGESEISGRVVEIASSDLPQKIIIENAIVNGEELSSNIYVFVYGAPYLQVGDNIEFNSEINKVSAYYDDNFSYFFYKNNIRYFSIISGNKVSTLGSQKTIAEIVQNSVKEKLEQNMTPDNASLAFASLFGDKAEIDTQTLDDYRGSGIAHILSVSGLHVTIIVGFIYWILKKLKSPKILTFILMASILAFYCYICGFSPSVVRASIMSVCLIGGALIGRKYDALSALGLAGIIILAISPLSALDIGFQLSFGCIAGIAMFYRPINDAFRKIKIPKFISSSMAISISAQFFIYPIMINSFGGASFLAVFLNVLVIPVFSLGYLIIFVSTPLLFLSNFFGNFLWFASLILEGINISANFVAGLTWSIIPKFELSLLFMLGFYSIVFVFSRFVLLNIKIKALVCSIIFIICTSLITTTQYIQI